MVLGLTDDNAHERGQSESRQNGSGTGEISLQSESTQDHVDDHRIQQSVDKCLVLTLLLHIALVCDNLHCHETRKEKDQEANAVIHNAQGTLHLHSVSLYSSTMNLLSSLASESASGMTVESATPIIRSSAMPCFGGI